MRSMVLGTVLALMPGLAAADWDEAVTTLAVEKTRAEACVAILKRHAADDPTKLSEGQLAYTDAKAEIDAVIASLSLSLATGEDIESFAGVIARLEKGVKAREAFCAEAVALMEETTGTRSGLTDVLGKALAAMIEAVAAIYIYHEEEDVLERKTIQTQIEAKTWDDWSDIQPAS